MKQTQAAQNQKTVANVPSMVNLNEQLAAPELPAPSGNMPKGTGKILADPNKEKEINLEQNKFVMNVNYFGVLNCVKSVEKYFKSKKQGHISIASSIAGYRGLPNSSGYGPSKAALTNFAESIYFDFKKYDVRISLVSPGFIKTPLTDKNEFNMPFLKSPEFAAKQIYSGLVNSNSFEIHFPIQLTLILKFLRILPYKIYLFLVEKLVKR